MSDVRSCEQCGTSYSPRREHARFCSARCRVAWNRQNASDLPAEAGTLDWSITAMQETTDRLLRATGSPVEVARDVYNLYIAEQHYGSFETDSIHDWEQLQGRFTLAFLFEYAATLGVIDGNPLVCGEDSEGGVLFSCRIGQEGANPNELGHVGWSTDHICVYSLSGNALTSDIFQVLAVY